jgi:hypothetical protein
MKKENKIMKKRYLVAALLFIVVMVVLMVVSTKRNQEPERIYYARAAVVTTIDFSRGYVGFTDHAGNEWFWWCDPRANNWLLDDSVLLTMHDNGTEWQYDDVLLSISTENPLLSVVH